MALPGVQSAFTRRQLAQSILNRGSLINPTAPGSLYNPKTGSATNGGDFLGLPAPGTPGGPPAAPPMGAPNTNTAPGAPSPTAGGAGVAAPFGSSSSDSPPAWLASSALAAYQAGNTAYMTHLLSDPSIAGNPHLANFIKGLFAGDADRIAEAKHYATNPSYNGWNNAAGDGIPGDGK